MAIENENKIIKLLTIPKIGGETRIKSDNIIIDFLKDDEVMLKRYRDILFLIDKINHSKTQFNKEYPSVISDLEKIGQNASLQQIESFNKQLKNKIKLDSLIPTNVEISLGYEAEFNNPIFFNLDTIIIDGKRVIEYYVKLLAKIMDKKEKMSIFWFFEGLDNNPKSKQDKNAYRFSTYMLKEHNQYCQYLMKEWNNWIKELNEYRNDAIHQSLKNHMHGKVNFTSKKGEPLVNSKMTSVEVKIGDEEVKKYVENLNLKITGFVNKGFCFLIDRIISIIS